MNGPETRVERYRDARDARPRADRRCLRAGRSHARRGDAGRGVEDRRRGRVARRRRGRARPARREPCPGGVRQGARRSRRTLAAGRPAPVEQGAPGARGVRGDPDGRLGRARAPARPAGARRSGRAAATRSCSRSTSTSIRPRPASRRPSSTPCSRRVLDAPGPRGPRADDGRPAHDGPGRGAADLWRAPRDVGAAAAGAGRGSGPPCRWG